MLTEEIRKKAVDIHTRDADWFEAQYTRVTDPHASSFKYGRRQVDKLLEDVLASLPPGARALDAGCGTGDLVAQLRARGFDAVGVEPSEGMRSHAAARLPEGAVLDGSVVSLPFPDASFDFVSAIEVLRYLDTSDNERALREIARVLKPGGVFFGTFVNLLAWDGFQTLIAARRLRKALLGKDLECHTEFETPSGLQRKLRASGFSVPDVHGAMFAPLRIAYRVSTSAAAKVAGLVEPLEPLLTRPPLHAFAGHLVAVARR